MVFFRPILLKNSGTAMKIALVCDWLVTYAGAERALEAILHCFPQADLFAVIDFLPPEQRAFLQHKPVTTTFIQKLPFAKKRYRSYLPLMPLAIERLDVSGYDVVISSSHAVAKGVRTTEKQLHLSYVHSPMRYAWDLRDQYLREAGLDRGVKGLLAKYMLHRLRRWDVRTVKGVDHFAANSKFIAQRIWRSYQRGAEVIYPPVNTALFTPQANKENFYLTASRMVPYKKMDLIVESFATMPDKKLVVVGDGPDMKKIKTKAAKNIEILGFQPQEKLVQLMQQAKAFVFAAEEDFGIAPVEAQACGTPVIAFGKGGALETVCGLEQEKPTGIFFPEQTVAALVNAVKEFERSQDKFSNTVCAENAARFATEKFYERFKRFVLRES